MNSKNVFMMGCYLMMQSLQASEQVSQISEHLVVVEQQKKAEIRKREYHVNMLKRYMICLENSMTEESQEHCTQEYSSALAYFNREQKKMHDSYHASQLVSNFTDTQK